MEFKPVVLNVFKVVLGVGGAGKGSGKHLKEKHLKCNVLCLPN